MKRRIGKNIAGICVAGLVMGAPGMALASEVGPEDTSSGDYASGTIESARWDSREVVVCLYGPPSMLGGEDVVVIDEPVEVLYGPPPTIVKNANPMTVRTTVKTVTAKKLKEAKRTLKGAITVKKAKGTVKFTRVVKGSSKKLSVDKTSGAITVKKGTKKGTYLVKVKVRAAGNSYYSAATKTVLVKVRVK